jgi:hypothetical protein
MSSLPATALPLADAIRKFVSRKFWIDFKRAKAKCAHFPPKLIVADAAARPNKTARNPRAELARSARADRNRAWERIEQSFIGQLVDSALVIYAQHEPPFGDWRALAPESCRGMRISDLHNGSVTASNFELVGVYVAEAQAPVAEATRQTTGGPGRPTSIHLIEGEFERRSAAGTLEPNLTKESNTLAEWFKETHPDLTQVKAKTIENKLRSRYRLARAPAALRPPKL